MDYQAKQMAKAAAAKAMQAAFPKLVAVSDKNNRLVAAAKNMRIQLAEAFPGIKFSVKSSRFSMGDSINVSWVDGPNSDQVDEIIDRYAAGHFNGMEDIYEYGKDAWNDAFGDAKYVSGVRQNSDKAIESAMRSVFARYGFQFVDQQPPSVADFRAGKCWAIRPQDGGHYNLQDLIYQVASKRVWCLNQAPKAVELEEAAS